MFDETSTKERIDDTYASVYEISAVSSRDRQTVDRCCRRDEAILDWHSFPGTTETSQQLRPFQTRVRIPGQTVETRDSGIKPAFQHGTLPSPGKDENPES
jgi:hypothetical protein